jgi:hypothetical protein
MDKLLFIRTDGFDSKYLNILVKEHIEKEKIEKEKEDKYYFIYIDQGSRQKLKYEEKLDTYTLKSYIKNTLKFIYSNKVLLYNHFVDSKYFPKNIIVSKETPLQDIIKFVSENKALILKPEETTKGNGIYVSPFIHSNKNEIDIIANFFVNKIKRLKRNAILSTYILDPMLYKDLKFHIRYYVIVVHSDKITRVCSCKCNKITTSKLKYKKSDFGNKDIHDTHGKNSLEVLFPRDMNDKEIQRRIEIMNKTIFEKLLPSFGKYDNEEAYICYDILGMDIMIDKNYNPFILEINQRVDYKIFKKEKDNDLLYGNLCKAIMSSIFSEEKEDGSFKEICRLEK